MNIWDDLSLEQVDTPLKILRQLTIGLSEKTSGVLDAQIKSTSDNNLFIHYFQIVCPKLNGYIHNLIQIKHNIFLYPCTIYDLNNPKYKELSSIEISQMALNSFNKGNPIERPVIANNKANDESELQTILEEILKSEKTMTIIKSLYTQSIQL